MVDADLTESFHLVIVSPDEILYEDDCRQAMVPGLTQELAILPNHTPLYAQLKAGVISTLSAQGAKNSYQIEGGMIRVKRNRVSIIVGFETRETLFKA